MVVEWSPRANERLAEIWDYYSLLNARAAEKIILDIRTSIYLLVNFPQMAPIEPLLQDAPDKYRSLIVAKRYKALYRVVGETIVIITIHDCRQNPARLKSTVR